MPVQEFFYFLVVEYVCIPFLSDVQSSTHDYLHKAGPEGLAILDELARDIQRVIPLNIDLIPTTDSKWTTEKKMITTLFSMLRA
jgi:hypothetical protein